MGILGFSFLRAVGNLIQGVGMSERKETIMDRAITHFSNIGSTAPVQAR